MHTLLCIVYLAGVVPGEETHNFPASRCRILCGHCLLDCGFFYGATMPKRGDVHPETGLVYWDKSGGIERWRPVDVINKWKKAESARMPWKRKVNIERKKKWHMENYAKYYSANREKILKRRSDLGHKHRARMRSYMKTRREMNLCFRITSNMRSRINYAVLAGKKALGTMQLVGCSVEFLRKYIESLFKPGMSWDNYGKYGWHIDHIKPCSLFDLSDKDQQIACFNYTNLQPMWAGENHRKGNRWIG